MEENSLISIIMPLYNASTYVAEAIQSIVNQTYQNWELIIVNDGSTDNSLEVAKQFESDKVKVYSQENRGASAARNFGYQQCKGNFIKFFDADDVLNSQMLEYQMVLAIKNPDNIISGKWGRFYNNDLQSFTLSPEECWKDMKPVEWICCSWYKANTMTQPGIFLIPRKIIDKAGLWNEELSLVDDMEFFTKNILASERVKFCEQSILYYRSGMAFNALSGRKSLKAVTSFFNSISFSTQYLLNYSQDSYSKLCCANIWQSFVYEHYFQYPALAKQAEIEINFLGGSDLKFPGGKFTKLLSKMVGWKIAKKIREMI